MTSPQRVIAALLCLAAAVHVRAQYVWTGHGATSDITDSGNWLGASVPPNNGTGSLTLAENARSTLTLSADFSAAAISLGFGTNYYIDAASPFTFTLNVGGILQADTDGNTLWFRSNVSLQLLGGNALDAGSGSITVSSAVAGSGAVSLYSSDANGGAFIFNNTGAGNSYTGNTTVGNSTNPLTVAFWNSSPFGTGNVTLLPNASLPVQLVAHGTQTVGNAITIASPGVVSFRSWDDVLTFTGNVTLDASVTFNGTVSPNALAAPNLAGSYPIPGSIDRNPILFSGTINETSGPRSLTVTGAGILFFTGTSSYTGTTISQGNLVYGSNAAVPTANTVVSLGGGYLGFADPTPGALATYLSTQVNLSTSTGAIGVDTLPGNSTSTYSDAINLSAANTALRIGSATTGIITGTITPQGANYQFGNGGGILDVQSNLTLAKGLTLQSNNIAFPLTVFLQGNNTYTGATSVTNGFLVFDSANALSPSTSSLNATGAATSVGGSYIGYTDVAGIASPAAFLSRFVPANTWGIIGFDTHVGNFPVGISNLDLTGFNDGVFIGTITNAIIDATTLTGTTVTNGNNAPNTLRFTAGQDGLLTVNGAINGGTAVMIGSPSISNTYSSGVVLMNGSSSYSGGTIVNAMNAGGITLGIGTNTALGTGPLIINADNAGTAALQAFNSGLTLSNAIILQNNGSAGPRLYFTGNQPFTVAGAITGDATTELDFYNASPLLMELAGDNSGFLGAIVVFNGILNLNHNNAAGLGTLSFGTDGVGAVTFGAAATAPVIHGIYGTTGTLDVPSTAALTIDLSDETQSREFGGVIGGSGSILLTAPGASTTTPIYLYGNSTHSGGITVSDKVVLGLGHSNAAGVGPVVLNAPQGGILLGPGVTFTNSLNYTAGLLAGFGTFAPTGTPNITFDTNRSVLGGSVGSAAHSQVGTLTFNTDVTLANGGHYYWGLQDAERADGASLLVINGNLNVTATAGGFTIAISTYDSGNDAGFANLTLGTPYSLPIASSTVALNGFDPSAFTIDASAFQGGTLSPTVFTLSQTGNTIFLNFTPVPEPSTYALLALGLATFAGLRRRKAQAGSSERRTSNTEH